jgi:hypothetical protein
VDEGGDQYAFCVHVSFFTQLPCAKPQKAASAKMLYDKTIPGCNTINVFGRNRERRMCSELPILRASVYSLNVSCIASKRSVLLQNVPIYSFSGMKADYR